MSGGRLERALFRIGRRLAHVQACQTREQLALLSSRQRKRAVLLRNVADTTLPWRPARGKTVLWVASIKPKAKRPHLFLDLAEALPRRRFRMVGDLRGPAEFQAGFRRRLAGLPNVDWEGPLERTELPARYAAARCLVNTSDTEGFPNTFLEACCAGLPIVSLAIDPDGLLREQGAGLALDGDPARLPQAVESTFDDAVWAPLSKAASAAAARHSPETAVAVLSRLLEEA
jgi:hypothetical protein